MENNLATQKKNARVERWRTQKEISKPDFSYQAHSEEDEKIILKAVFKDSNLTEQEKSEIQQSSLALATGSFSTNFSRLLLSQAIAGFFTNQYQDQNCIVNSVHEALLAMQPADEHEGMLCSRLLVLHNQYMHFMTQATGSEISTKSVDLNINRATKLMRVYNETLEALNRYRRKGEQKVTVQHVNVGNGGQAVVAGEFSRGGVKSKK